MVTTYEDPNGQGPGKWRETTIDPYTAAPWSDPLRVRIEVDDTCAIRTHDADETPHERRVYSDGSGKDGSVTAAAVDIKGWEKTSKLGGAGVVLTYYSELEGLATASEELAERCTSASEPQMDLIYRVYSDSQASLKVARSMGSEWDQGRLRRILNAHEAISARGATLSLVWIPGHRGVLGNEMADKAAERTQREREPAGIVREPAAKVAQVLDTLMAK